MTKTYPHNAAFNSIDRVKIKEEKELFPKRLEKKANEILHSFSSILQETFPLSSHQKAELPQNIRNLSRVLTTDRQLLKRGYMNTPPALTSYMHYFLWWNLLRLTKVFAALPYVDVENGDVLLDIGSGPLTVPLSLYLSRPELRKVKLKFLCMDTSENALKSGMTLFEKLQSLLGGKNEWQIVKIKGKYGDRIKEKAKIVFLANIFNEILQKKVVNPDTEAKSILETLEHYTGSKGSFFIAEPGVPVNAALISSLRKSFLAKGYRILSPCTHEMKCPMNGKGAHTGSRAKWCALSFSTSSCPPALLELSTKAHLTKTRALISFVYAAKKDSTHSESEKDKAFRVRITSDKIMLPLGKTGFYGCSALGLLLLIQGKNTKLKNSLELVLEGKLHNIKRALDVKTGAVMLEVESF